MFGADIQSQTKVRVRKPKILTPDGHFESGITENQWASVRSQKQHEHEI